MHSYYTIMYLIVLHFIRSCFIHTNRSHSFIQFFFFFSSNRLGQNSPINDGQNGSFQFLVIKTSAIRKIFEDIYVKHGCPHGKHLPAQPGPQRPDSYHFSFPVVKNGHQKWVSLLYSILEGAFPQVWATAVEMSCWYHIKLKTKL